MIYTIPDPDNVVEAGYSNNPDDVSVVSIAVEATLDPSTAHRPPEEPPRQGDSIEFRLDTSLTTSPGTVTPQARSFADWEMASSVQQDDDGDGVRVFVATARRDLGGDEWMFYLRDVEVAPGAGPATMTVTEVRAGVAAAPVTLTVRKVDPALRIDSFYVVDSLDSGAWSATSTSGRPMTLTWATSAADAVSLHGPEITMVGGSQEGEGPDRSSFSGGILPKVFHDGSATVSPLTTSTYTLVASNAAAHAVAQVTVTVTDKLVAPDIEADSLRATGEVRAGSVTADGEVEAQSFSIGDTAGMRSNGRVDALWLNVNDGTATIQPSGRIEAESLRIGPHASVSPVGIVAAQGLTIAYDHAAISESGDVKAESVDAQWLNVAGGLAKVRSDGEIEAAGLDIAGGLAKVRSTGEIDARGVDVNGGKAKISSTGEIEAQSLVIGPEDPGAAADSYLPPSIHVRRGREGAQPGAHPMIRMDDTSDPRDAVFLDVRRARETSPEKGSASGEGGILFIGYGERAPAPNPLLPKEIQNRKREITRGAFLDRDFHWQKTSDAALKKGVRPLGEMLDVVMRLRPVEFTWADAGEGAPRQLGFVAQEVEDVVPELVGRMPTPEGSPPLRSMSYSPIDAITVAAVRELKERTDQQLDALRSEIEALRALLAGSTEQLDDRRAPVKGTSS